jgi:hypothetical protein
MDLKQTMNALLTIWVVSLLFLALFREAQIKGKFPWVTMSVSAIPVYEIIIRIWAK